MKHDEINSNKPKYTFSQLSKLALTKKCLIYTKVGGGTLFFCYIHKRIMDCFVNICLFPYVFISVPAAKDLSVWERGEGSPWKPSEFIIVCSVQPSYHFLTSVSVLTSRTISHFSEIQIQTIHKSPRKSLKSHISYTDMHIMHVIFSYKMYYMQFSGYFSMNESTWPDSVC